MAGPGTSVCRRSSPWAKLLRRPSAGATAEGRETQAGNQPAGVPAAELLGVSEVRSEGVSSKVAASGVDDESGVPASSAALRSAPLVPSVSALAAKPLRPPVAALRLFVQP
jgi:hypothetical protein